MIKKVRCFAILLGLFFLSLSSVDAASTCSYEKQVELNNTVANVKASYEIKKEVIENVLPPDDIRGTEAEADYVAYAYYFKINILNITDDIYAVITNNIDKSSITVNANNLVDGIYSYEWRDLSQIVNLTISLYASNKTECSNELYRVIYLTLPKFNYYSSYDMCKDAQDFYLCKQFVTYDSEVPMNVFADKISEYKEGKTNSSGDPVTNKTGVWEFIKKNKNYFIGGGVLVIAIAGEVVIVNTLKRRKTK